MRKNIEKLRIASLDTLLKAQDTLEDFSHHHPDEEVFDRVTIGIAMQLNDLSQSYADLADFFGTWRCGEMPLQRLGK